MKQKYLIATCAIAFAGIAFANAAPTVDGTLGSGEGYSTYAIQTNSTGFGDNTSTTAGSELDGAYATITGGNLYLMFTGNLEANFNHLNVFFDTGASGQNVLSGTSSGMDGLTLSQKASGAFNASTFLDFNGDGNNLYVNQYSYSGGTWTNTYLGDVVGAWGTGANALSGGTNTNGLAASMNNSNVLGVTGTTASSAAASAVTTGLEISVPMLNLGSPTGNIDVIAAINGGGNGFLSNQFLSGLALGTANLGNSTVANLTTVGNPYFTIKQQAVPAPSSLLALGVGMIALIKRRKA